MLRSILSLLPNSLRILYLFLVLFTIFRLVTLATIGLGDAEAYYWTWSQELSWSYFDHGPLVAYLIRFGTSILGDTPLGVRWPFILLSSLTLWGCARCAKLLAEENPATKVKATRVGSWWAVLSVLAMPIFIIAGGAANPDIPFIASAVFGYWALLIAARKKQWPWDLLAGAIIGLGFCAKYFAGLMIVPLLIVCAGPPLAYRRLLSALASFCITALPVFYWNATHHWASFLYHLSARHSQRPHFSWANLGRLVGGQLGYISPLLLLGFAVIGVMLWREYRHRQHLAVKLTLAFSISQILVGFLLILLVPSAEPHWPLAGYLPLAIMLGVRLPTWMKAHPRLRYLVAFALLYSSVLGVIAHLHVLTNWGIKMMPPSYNPRYDLSNELYGWERVGEKVARQLADGPEIGMVVGCHYTSCAQLAFVARGRFSVRCPSPRRDQFDYQAGGDGSALVGNTILYVKDNRFPYDAAQLFKCSGVIRSSIIPIYRGSRLVRQFELQLCQDFAGLNAVTWPPPEGR